MKQFKGTKGEWTCKHRSGAGFEVLNEKNNIICAMGWYQIPSDIMNLGIEEANAKLIAAAPELLKALELIMSNSNDHAIIRIASKAINKAL